MDDSPITPNSTPEVRPLHSPEIKPAAGPETSPAEKQVERAPAAPEKAPSGQGLTLPPVQPPPQLPTTAQPVKVADDDDDDTPAIAEDTDVIEMEWVNQAKKVIKATKDDPHAQELGVEKLQRNYLKKRFGKDIIMSSG